jgi:hypothetical protein
VKFRLVSALVVMVLSFNSAFGQFYPIKIESAKVGLPAGPGANLPEIDGTGVAYLCKPNTWAPVYVELSFAREVKSNAVIVVETMDPD